MKFFPVCFLLGLLVLTTACGQKAVANASSEDEANEMLDVLREEGLEADKQEVAPEDGSGNERKQWRVVIDDGWFGNDNVARAVRVLRDNGLPRPVDKGFEGAYDEKSIIPSESAQRTQRMKELKTEIERQLRLLPGVTRVSVIIVPPDEKSFSFDKYEPTASVVIVRKEQSPPLNEADVQQLVAKGVPNLKAENVSVRLSTQAARPFQHREAQAQPRNKFLIAVGTGLLVVLAAMLIAVLLQARQQRRTIAELRAGHETSAARPEEESESATLLGEGAPLSHSNTTGERRWPGDASSVSESGSSDRLLTSTGNTEERAG